VSRFDLWNDDVAGLSSSDLFPLTEAGLPIGWVSLWKVAGKKVKRQKTKDGWVNVPYATPLGQQAILPRPGKLAKPATPDEEMKSYLQSVNFDDPKIQAQLLKTKKFVQDMVAKFGGNWQDKAKKAKDAEQGVPPEAPPPTTDPVTATVQALGYAPDSKEAFVVAQLHQHGDTGKAASAVSQKYGKGYGWAANFIETDVLPALKAKGLITTDALDEIDFVVKFTLGKEGAPVISAPTVAVSASAPSAPPEPAASKELDDLIASLGYKSGTDAALAVGLIKASPDDLKGVSATLASAQGLHPDVAAAVVAQVHQKMAHAGLVSVPTKTTKKKKTTTTAAPTAPVEAPVTTLANLPVEKVNDLKKKLDIKPGTIGDWALSALVTNGGDEGLAVAALIAVNPKIDHDHAQKLAAALNKLALATLNKKSVVGIVDAPFHDLDLPIHTNALQKSKPPEPEPVAAPPPFTPPSGKTYAPLPASLVGLSPKITDLVVQAGFAAGSEEAKLLNLWQSNGGAKSPKDATYDDLVALGWDGADAEKFMTYVADKFIDAIPATVSWSELMKKDPAKKPVLDYPVPDLSSLDIPVDAKTAELATKLGFSASGSEAKMLAVWRKKLAQGLKLDGSLTSAGNEISDLVYASPIQATAPQVQKVLTKLVNAAYGLPDFLDYEFTKNPPSEQETKKKAMVAAGQAYLASIPKDVYDKYVEHGDISPEDEVFFGVLADYDIGAPFSLQSALQQAAEELLGMDYAAAGAAATNFRQLMKEVGIVIESPGGDEFTVGTKHSVFKFPTAGTEVEPAKVSPEPAPAPAPAGHFPAPPPLSSLTDAGDAQKKLGGNKPKRFMKDSGGNLFLYKHGADVLRARGGEVASNLSALIAGAGAYVPVRAVEKDGDWGTVQPVVPNITMLGTNKTADEDLKALSPEQIRQLQRERVIDWVCSNHDCKIGNFIKTKDGSILGIDKEQAFKFIGQDKLSTDYEPNPSPPVYNALYNLYAEKKLDLDPNDVLPFIQAVEGVSEDDWRKAVQPYIDALPVEERVPKLSAILARKNGVRTEFELFFSGLMKKRGELSQHPMDLFKFPKTGTAAAPKPASPVPGVLATPVLPALASLTYAGPASGIGGASEKHWFKDASGKKWMVKLAADKNTKKPQPFKAAAAAMFAKVGLAVKSNTVPVGLTTYEGKPAAIQPWVEATGNLASKVPAALTTQQKADVAAEHILDWMMSQHDSHGANLLILPDGRVTGIDKEQAFKFMLANPALPNTPDELSTDYHPNTMENPPYYNKFWAAFAEGKMDFDPTVMKSAIEAIEKIPDDAYAQELAGYAAQQPKLVDANLISAFYAQAIGRKQNIRPDFEKFITGLYEKRTKKKGKFTFAGGWVPEGAVVAAPAATAQSLPTAPAPVGTQPVPKPVNYVPPPIASVKNAAAAMGIAQGGEYYKALQQLAAYNFNPNDAAAQLAYVTGDKHQVCVKRVKYVLKKLKAVGGWVGATKPVVPSAASVAAAPPMTPGEPVDVPAATAVQPPKEAEAAAASATAQKALQTLTGLDAVSAGEKREAMQGVLSWIVPSGSGLVGRPDTDPVWEKLAASPAELLSAGAVFTALGKIPPVDFEAMVRPIAEASHPGNRLLQDAFVQDAVNRKNTTKYRVEQALTEVFGEKTGEEGKFAFDSGGWVAAGAKPKPIIKDIKKTAAMVADEMGVKVRPWKSKDGAEDPTRYALKVYGTEGVTKAEEFLKKMGLTALSAPVEKKKEGGGSKFLIPVSREALDKAFITEQQVITPEEQIAAKGKIPPHPGTPSYLPAHAPARPIAQSFADLDKANSGDIKLTRLGRAFPSDGPALWGSTGTINVRRVVKTDGKTKLLVTFKLKDRVKVAGKDTGWKTLTSSGASGSLDFKMVEYDAAADALRQTNVEWKGAWESIPARVWKKGKHELKMCGSNPYATAGLMAAELELDSGESLTGALRDLLDAAQPGLADAVLHDPTPEDREVQKLHQILFTEAPDIERALAPEDFNVATLTSKVKSRKSLAPLLDSQEVEVQPGIKSFYKAGRWKDLLPKGGDGEPALKYFQTSASTPKFIVQALKESGPLSIVSRMLIGGGGQGASDSDDMRTGGAQFGMWRAITTNSAKSGLFQHTNSGNVGGPYKYILPPDEADRLDVAFYHYDAFGAEGKDTSMPDKWKSRLSMSETIKRRDSDPSGTGTNEIDWMSGVHASRILRIVTQSEASRVALVSEAKTQGLHEVNGVPIEDFVVVESSAQAVYDKYVKPLGF
jgi:hypothetical protein